MNVAAESSAGLGLFFIGIRLLSTHLRELASGPVRALLSKTLTRPGMAAISGLVSGALTQSTSATTFIATGLVAAQTMTLPTALTLLAWANVGTSALVLLASIDLRTLVLYLLGVIGCVFLGGVPRNERTRHGLFALFGLALLILGLSMVKGSVAELRSNPWVEEFLEFAGSGPAISMLAGFVIAIIVQSSSIVAALALPLVAAGLLDMPATALMILGATVGSGAAVVLLSSGLEGTARQMAIAQGLLRTFGVLILLPAFLISSGESQPYALRVLEGISHTPTIEAGLLFLLAQLSSVLVSTVGKGAIARLAVRLAPPSHHETLGQPRYLFDGATSDATTALSLVRLEHIRLLKALPDFLEELRPPEERHPEAPPLAVRAAASGELLSRVEDFLTATMHANPTVDAEAIFEVRSRLTDLAAVQDTLAQFAGQLLSVPGEERPAFVRSLVEGLHAILAIVGDACEEDGGDARELLTILTDERGELVDRVRSELLRGASSLGGRESLLTSTLLLERLIWMLRNRSPLPPAASVERAQA